MDPIFGNLTVCFTRRDATLRWPLLRSAAIASIGILGCDGLIPRAGEVTQDPRDPVKGLSGSRRRGSGAGLPLTGTRN